jgi:hypothetical protein
VSEVPPADPPIAADPPADAPAHAGPSPLLEKFERLMRIGSAIVAALFFLCILLPSDHLSQSDPTWIWDMVFEKMNRKWYTPLLLEFIELIILVFPVTAVPLMTIAAWVKQSPTRFFAIKIATFLQFGPPAAWVIIFTSAGNPSGVIAGVALAFGGVIGFLAASATGLAMGTRKVPWRLGAGLGGALLVFVSFLSFGLTTLFLRYEWEAHKWLQPLSSVAGLLAGVAGIGAALSLRHRVSFAKACLFGIGTGVLFAGMIPLTSWHWFQEELAVFLHYAVRVLAGGLLGWLFLMAKLQSFSPIEE